MKLHHALAAAAATCLVASAGAAPVTYTFSGTTSTPQGDGSNRTDTYSLVIEAQTENIDGSVPGLFIVAADSHQFTLGSGPATTITNSGLYVAIDNVVGLAFGFDTGDWLVTGLNSALTGYALDIDFGPLSVVAPPYATGVQLGLASGGFWTFGSIDNVSFSAEVRDNVVPEPGSFALAGLALAGLALTRRRG